MLLVGLAELESGRASLALAVDRDDPLIAVLLDIDDRRGLQERLRDLGPTQVLYEVLEVLGGRKLVLADDLHHDEGDDGFCDYCRDSGTVWIAHCRRKTHGALINAGFYKGIRRRRWWLTLRDLACRLKRGREQANLQRFQTVFDRLPSPSKG